MARKTSSSKKANDATGQDSSGASQGSGDTASAEVKSELGAATAEAADQVQESTGRLVEQVQQQVATRVAEQKDKVVSAMETATLVVHQLAEQIEHQEHATAAQYVEDGAQRLEQWTNSLREQDASQIVEETQQFARQRPALFLGGAFTLGILGTRFFRSSARGQETEQQEQPTARPSDLSSLGVESPVPAYGTAATYPPGSTAPALETPSDYATVPEAEIDPAPSLSEAAVGGPLEETSPTPADYRPTGEAR